MDRLAGKVVLMTGCSAGIGKQAALLFAKEGASLAINARRANKLGETKKLCEEAGAQVLAIPGDILDYAHLQHLVQATVEKFGKIDVLINNADINTQGIPLEENNQETLDDIMGSNFFAVWHLMRLCYPHMKANGGGSIVNICSGAGVTGLPGFAPYASAKEATRGLSRVAANEWGKDNIRVNVICPACMTDTIQEVGFASFMEQVAQSVAMKRVGDPYADVAPVYLFFASDDSKFVTGQTIAVDGGGLVRP